MPIGGQAPIVRNPDNLELREDSSYELREDYSLEAREPGLYTE
jgi:hypothetical protein